MIKEKIIKIKNYEELIKLFEYADKMGNKWSSGRSLLDLDMSRTAYKAYENQNLCILFDKEGRVQYSPYDFYKEFSKTYDYEYFNVSDIVKDIEFNF